MRKLLGLLFASMFVFAVVTPMRGQEATTTKKPAKEARWEGTVVRISSNNPSLAVRQVGGNVEKTILIDSATAWTSQAHGSKTVNKSFPG